MAKKTKLASKATTDDIKVKEVSYYTTSGQRWLTMWTFPVSRKLYQTERILRALPVLYPNGCDGIPTTVIHREVVKALEHDSQERGLRDPSIASVARVLGRR